VEEFKEAELKVFGQTVTRMGSMFEHISSEAVSHDIALACDLQLWKRNTKDQAKFAKSGYLQLSLDKTDEVARAKWNEKALVLPSMISHCGSNWLHWRPNCREVSAETLLLTP
jgi:hypothetical protein